VTRALDRFSKRHPRLTMAGAIFILALIAYFAIGADQDNDTALRWQIAAARGQAT
jgi:hypothetical protein